MLNDKLSRQSYTIYKTKIKSLRGRYKKLRAFILIKQTRYM